MNYQAIDPTSENEYNQIVHHPLQAYEWGEFREKTGIKVIRKGFEKDPSAYSTSSGQTGLGQVELVDGFQLTIHRIPHTPWSIGYLPKGNMPTKEVIEELKRIGKEQNCIFIQLEPNVIQNVILREAKDLDSSAAPQNDAKKVRDLELITYNLGLVQTAHPLFTKYTMVLDLTKSEEELLKNMHSKTRYNIKVAEKHGVTVQEDDSDKAFNRYLQLTKETTGRQGFFAHTHDYHKKMWDTLKSQIANSKSQIEDLSVIARSEATKQSHTHNQLKAHLLTATYQGKILVTWIVFVFHDTLYYPYGASSSDHREVMASTAMMWETIRWGKKKGLKKFDMWGALGPEPDPKDPWYGFHRFKQGFGPEIVEFVGSYDLVINPLLYELYKIADKLRWILLRLKR